VAAPDQVLEDLHSADEEVRRAALTALTGSPDLRALPDLRWAASGDESVELRFLAKRAILALAGVSPDGTTAFKAPDLDDADPQRRVMAVHARAARGKDEDLETLRERLAFERDASVRPVLALALGAAGSRAQIPALEPLLDDEDANVRIAALQAFALLRDSAAYPYFVRFARDADDRLRTFAMGQLAQLGREKVIKLCEVMARAPRRWMIAAGLNVLSGLKDERFLPLFIQHLGHADASVQERAREGVERFAEVGNTTARDALRKLAPAPPSMPGIKIELPDMGPKELRNPDPAARLTYVQTVLTRRDTEAIPDLIAHLERESDMRVLSTLVTVLGQMGDAAAIEGLREFLVSPNDRVRANAVEAIGRLAAASARGVLVKSLDDPHNRVRTNAILALWGTGPTSVRDALVGLKNSTDRKARLSAIYAIGQIGEQAAGMLNDLLADEDREIAQKAKECWRMLGLEDPSGSVIHKGDRIEAPASAGAAVPADAGALQKQVKELEAQRDAALRDIADGYLERVGKSLVAPPDLANAMGAVTAARAKFKHNKPETRSALLEKQTALARAIVAGSAWDDDVVAEMKERLEAADAGLVEAKAKMGTAGGSRRGMMFAIAAIVLVVVLVALSVVMNRD
jgi:HEAT repeat protein